jgi:hypothetical protein
MVPISASKTLEGKKRRERRTTSESERENERGDDEGEEWAPYPAALDI